MRDNTMSEWFEAKYGVEGFILGDGLINIAVFFEATEDGGHKVSMNHKTLNKKFKDRRDAKKEAVLWATRMTEQALTELKEIKDE